MQAAHSRNATAIALLRIFVGIFFLVFGQYKVFGQRSRSMADLKIDSRFSGAGHLSAWHVSRDGADTTERRAAACTGMRFPYGLW
jgi:hypothetical protein